MRRAWRLIRNIRATVDGCTEGWLVFVGFIHGYPCCCLWNSRIDSETMKTFPLSFSIALACVAVNAQTNIWQPSPGHVQVPIWPGTIPDPLPFPGPENALVSKGPAGNFWAAV